MNLAYYPGCSLYQSSLLYHEQNKLVFNALGLNLHEIKDWSCCGATSAGKVNDFMASAMPARNLGLAEAAGYGEMVIPCSACYSRTLVAQNRLRDDMALRNDINGELDCQVNGNIKVSSILEVLIRLADNGDLAGRVCNELGELEAACYYGCMLTRFPYDVPIPDNVENPQAMENILAAVGIRSLDWNYKTRCCGASAVVNDPETASKLMADILRDALARKANCLVVTCPMCQMNLDAYQDHVCKRHNIDERIPVYFITELLGMAMGLSREELRLNRHFIDDTTLLNNCAAREAMQAETSGNSGRP